MSFHITNEETAAEEQRESLGFRETDRRTTLAGKMVDDSHPVRGASLSDAPPDPEGCNCR